MFLSRSVFLDFIHRLVSSKPKIIRPRTKNPKKTKKTNTTSRKPALSETSCVVLLPFVYSGCYFCFNTVLVWVSIFTHGFIICMCVCSGLFYGFFLGGGVSSWSCNFWFIGHQTTDKVQKYASTDANTPSSETYRSEKCSYSSLRRQWTSLCRQLCIFPWKV
jgi:hypothetical protein